jgi:DNA-binding protein H-NS
MTQFSAMPPNPNDMPHGENGGANFEACEAKVKDRNLESMSTDELWNLHEQIRELLSTKLDAEKHELERRLAGLNGQNERNKRARRPYPKVYPKFRNPDRPNETWSGRGRQPHWVTEQLKVGKKVDDLLISRAH